MSQLKQCSNGHYYDPSMYPSCPYCSGTSTGIDRSVSNYDIKTTTPAGSIFTNPSGSGTEGGPTVPPSSGISTEDVKPTSGTNGETVRPDKPVIEDYGVTKPVSMPRREYKDTAVIYQPATPAQPKTAEPEELPQSSVVGWLVAVEGPYVGKSFELHHEYNYIGRETGDIKLAKDPKVSRVKNAWVMYSGRNNRFKFGAGESSNIVYINDDELAANASVTLKPYDQIEIGDSKFRFVPFCSEQFQW